jgi:hypothetical protein
LKLLISTNEHFRFEQQAKPVFEAEVSDIVHVYLILQRFEHAE